MNDKVHVYKDSLGYFAHPADVPFILKENDDRVKCKVPEYVLAKEKIKDIE